MAKGSVQFDLKNIPGSVRLLVDSLRLNNRLDEKTAAMVAMMVITDHGPGLTEEELGVAWTTVRKDYLGVLPGSYSTKPLQ